MWCTCMYIHVRIIHTYIHVLVLHVVLQVVLVLVPGYDLYRYSTCGTRVHVLPLWMDWSILSWTQSCIHMWDIPPTMRYNLPVHAMV